ncbi:hypothetical protein VS85_02682 [Vibrio cholerae]|nr:hypothetical protein VS85_02682 [Vibrio cholerae]
MQSRWDIFFISIMTATPAWQRKINSKITYPLCMMSQP